MVKAVFPGSFDPPTYGHINVIDRAVRLFDEVYIVIANNINKAYFCNASERYEMMKAITAGYENVSVHIWDSLIVDFAKENNARVLIRGVRALADFNYEFELSMINKGLNPDIETIFIPTDPQYFVLRSSSIKEVAKMGGDISNMVPPGVEKVIINKIT